MRLNGKVMPKLAVIGTLDFNSGNETETAAGAAM